MTNVRPVSPVEPVEPVYPVQPVKPSLPTAPTYLTTCPNDGAPLQPVALDPDTAPWLCNVCRRGWWVSELQTSARSAWRVQFQDFGFGDTMLSIREQVRQERVEAVTRGTSLRPEQLLVLPPEQLKGLRLVPGLSSDFMAVVKVVMQNRGVTV